MTGSSTIKIPVRLSMCVESVCASESLDKGPEALLFMVPVAWQSLPLAEAGRGTVAAQRVPLVLSWLPVRIMYNWKTRACRKEVDACSDRQYANFSVLEAQMCLPEWL